MKKTITLLLTLGLLLGLLPVEARPLRGTFTGRAM